MKYKPSSIDIGLSGKPEVRAKLERLARDFGVTIDALHAAIAAEGINTSRSAVARWHLKLRESQSRHGPFSVVRVAAIEAVTHLSRQDLGELVEHPLLRETVQRALERNA